MILTRSCKIKHVVFTHNNNFEEIHISTALVNPLIYIYFLAPHFISLFVTISQLQKDMMWMYLRNMWQFHVTCLIKSHKKLLEQ